MNQSRFVLVPIGWIGSPLTDRASVPRQGYEGSPEAWLVFEPWVLQGLEGIRAHDEVIVLTWLDCARRDVLRVHPRGDLSFLTAYWMEAPTTIDPTIGYTGSSITGLA